MTQVDNDQCESACGLGKVKVEKKVKCPDIFFTFPPSRRVAQPNSYSLTGGRVVVSTVHIMHAFF